MDEVNGWELENVPRTKVRGLVPLPATIPILFNKNRRLDRLQSPAIAVRLRDLFSEKTGKLKFATRQQLADRFRFEPNSQLVIIGVSEDLPLELYWERARENGFPDSLLAFEPALVTAPNFSLFNNVPRWDNLHSMKRIALCWREMVEAGLRASLHINARTDKDYSRWAEFIVSRDEVQSITFEFGTGAGIPARSRWHVDHLCALGDRTGGRLQLILKGGREFIGVLTPHFAQAVFLDSSSFMKAVSRKVMGIRNGKPVWDDAITLRGQSVDALLQHNVDTNALLHSS
ncbi:MAG: hypothetical protein ABSE73_01125 [Planctomycetota bacterium]